MTHGKPAPAAESEPFTASLERMNLFQEPEARAIIADLRLPQGSRGLDVGCGVGLFALWLAQSIGAGGCVVGVEPTEERAKAARDLVGARLDGQLEFRQGDGTALAVEDGSFDWLWCGDVLHHIVETDAALREFRRVVRPSGRVVVKESQVLSAMFLPGHPELERRIQLAELERTREEGQGRSFLERRQRTRESLRAAGLEGVETRSYLLERRAPLGSADIAYIQKTVFDRNWGERLRPLLSADDWTLRTALCEAGSPQNVLRSADYYCLYPITVFAARVP
jgi:demethylmenaquinone methyltransferase/2-methoxy-6-polyprenyl-1,4-benzoquinol methylase